MSIFHHTLTSDIKRYPGAALLQRLQENAPACSEVFWFCLSFLLFLVMGPFSAVAVIIALFSLAGEEQRQGMSEPDPAG